MVSVARLHKVAANKAFPASGFVAAVLAGMKDAFDWSVKEISGGLLVLGAHQTS